MLGSLATLEGGLESAVGGIALEGKTPCIPAINKHGRIGLDTTQKKDIIKKRRVAGKKAMLGVCGSMKRSISLWRFFSYKNSFIYIFSLFFHLFFSWNFLFSFK